VDGGLLKIWTQVIRIANQKSFTLDRVFESKFEPGFSKEKLGAFLLCPYIKRIQLSD
jgi:hypothetical protein